MDEKTTKSSNFDVKCTRPNASSGYWLCSLVPLSLCINVYKHEQCSSPEYQMCSLIAVGLLLQNVNIFYEICSDKKSSCIRHVMPGIVTSVLFWLCMDLDIFICIPMGVLPTLAFAKLYKYILRSMPESYTLGEGAIIVQGMILFMCSFILQIPMVFIEQPIAVIDNMRVILQLGFFGVMLLLTLCHFCSVFKKPVGFYGTLLLIFCGINVFRVGETMPVIYLLMFVFGSYDRLALTVYNMGLLGLTVSTVGWQLNRKQMSTTRTRKIFHLFITAVYVPSLLYQCTYLYVASGVILAVMIVLEKARVVQLYPVHEVLDFAVSAFLDKQDAGGVALTPLYLLAGCSLPLWLHPCPCDMTDSTVFVLVPLLSGVLSVGIGDTMASVVGSKLGRHKWKDSNKSIEGTIGSVVFQFLFLGSLFLLGIVHVNIFKFSTCLAIVVNALVEAKTDQIDNIVLPLVTYIILCI